MLNEVGYGLVLETYFCLDCGERVNRLFVSAQLAVLVVLSPQFLVNLSPKTIGFINHLV